MNKDDVINLLIPNMSEVFFDYHYIQILLNVLVEIGNLPHGEDILKTAIEGLQSK